MFKVLVIQATNTLSDERTEFLINDRLSFMRFLGLGLSDRVPDARTIWLFREKLTKAGAIKGLFERFDAALRAAGFIAMSGQIIDASLVAAPKQRNTDDEKKALKAGLIPEAWKARPGKLRQKDRDARWTVKFSKAKERPDGTKPPVDIAIPGFGYQNHIGIDRAFGLIRTWMVTDAAAYEGARLREGLLDKTNTASAVWADSAYRSGANEEHLRQRRLRQPDPPQEAAGQADAGKDPSGQCREIEGAVLRRARLRPAEIPHGAVRTNHRDRPRDDENRHGQPRLQCEETDLPADQGDGLSRRSGPRSPGRSTETGTLRPCSTSFNAATSHDTDPRRGVDRTVQLRPATDRQVSAPVSGLRRQDRVDVRARHEHARDHRASAGDLRHRRVADLISAVTDAVLEEVAAWQARPLDTAYPLVFFDAIRVKIRDEGIVRNKAIHIALGVLASGEEVVLGLWVEQNGGAKFWLHVMNKLGPVVRDIMLAVDGLLGLPRPSPRSTEAVAQTCIVHLLRNSMNHRRGRTQALGSGPEGHLPRR